MADLNYKDKKLAKRIAQLVSSKGDAVKGEVLPALEKLIGSRALSARRRFIKHFLICLEREQRARHLLIEHAGPILPKDIDAVKAEFASKVEGLTVETREEPSILGGVRVTLGDNVFDASVAGRLARLSTSTL
jgi:F-type H+-transporting ATPase subunit delta|tara:strand:- start:57143 stop:57541 length:399 start_codon:yes stop_codon:yes gene_type:complete